MHYDVRTRVGGIKVGDARLVRRNERWIWKLRIPTAVAGEFELVTQQSQDDEPTRPRAKTVVRTRGRRGGR